MAFVAKPVITVTYTFRDNDDKESTVQLYMPGATAPATAISNADSMRAILAQLSDAIIVSQNVLFGSQENTIPTIPSSDIENKGVFLFNAANGQPSSIAIPSILESLLQTNNQDINQAYTQIGDFINAMTLGLTGIQSVNASGADLSSIKTAYKQNRRSHLGSNRIRKG
jgi:hypothetical protein